MTRKLVCLLIFMPLSAALWAADSASISGTVRNAAGAAQMGASVELYLASQADAVESLSPVATAFTDSRGGFQLLNLAPRVYFMKVAAPSYLPSYRDHVDLAYGASLVVDVTLRNLLEVLQAAPARSRTAADDDDWKWTLRSAANRPILRIMETDDHDKSRHSKKCDLGSDHVDAAACAREAAAQLAQVKAKVAFVAGSDGDGFGAPPDVMTTTFNVERSLFTSGTLGFRGNVDYSNGAAPATVMRASYSHVLSDGSTPQVSVTVRRFATPDMVAHDAALAALNVSAADTLKMGQFLDLNFGGEYQTVQYLGRVSAMRPNGSADFHLSPHTLLQYRFATAQPNTRALKGFDSAPADLTETGLLMSLVNNNPVLERAHHHELSLTRALGKTSLQAAIFNDKISNPALTGVGYVTADSGQFLPDFYSGTFTWSGPGMSANGLRVVAEREIFSSLTGTVDYSYGGVLELGNAAASWSNLDSVLQTERRHSIACKLGGSLNRTHTRWIASYKLNSGGAVLTPVDEFNVSPGQADPYFSLFIRQPIPGGFLGDHVEALIDLRNLLAQGYVPVLGLDGQTLYLVQTARSLRGGLAFSF